MVKSVVVLVLLGLLAVHAASALKCHVCDDCGDKEGDSKDCGKKDDKTDKAKAIRGVVYDDPPVKPSTTPLPTTTAPPKTTLPPTTVAPSNTVDHCFYVKSQDKVYRGCTKQANCKGLAGETKYNAMTECKICKEDDCNNGAGSIKSWAFMSVVLIALTRIFLN